MLLGVCFFGGREGYWPSLYAGVFVISFPSLVFHILFVSCPYFMCTQLINSLQIKPSDIVIADHDFLLFSLMKESDFADHDFLLFSLMESDIVDHDFPLFSLMKESDIAVLDFLLFFLANESDIAVLSREGVRHCCSLS